MDSPGQAADHLRHETASSPAAHALPPWRAEDVQSLRPGQPLSSSLITLFFRRVLLDLLRRELAGNLSVLSRCPVVHGGALGHEHALRQVTGAQHADYLLFPLVGQRSRQGAQPCSLVLACASGEVLLHLDSQRGTVAGPADQARCLRGHLPHTSGAERADCSSPGEALVADLRAALCALGGRYAGAQRWPLKAVKVPLQRHAGDSALFMCTNALYLLAGLPGQLTPMAADVVSRFRDTDIDLFEGSKSCYPGFLTREWYSPQAAEALRKELAAALRRELEQLGPPGQPLLDQLAAVEQELRRLSRRPFQLPSERLERQQWKKEQRVLMARRPVSARWAALAAPLAVNPPAAEEAVRWALQRLQQLLGPPQIKRQPLECHAAGGIVGEPGSTSAPGATSLAIEAAARASAPAAAPAHEQQGPADGPSGLGHGRASSKRAASGEAGGPEMPAPAAKVPRHAAAGGAATAAAAAHAGSTAIQYSPLASPAGSPASVSGGGGARGGAPAVSTTSSGGRSYSRWRLERGGLVKALSASDLLKLRFKGSAAELLAKHLTESDHSVLVTLATGAPDGGAQQRSWLVGVWRAGKGRDKQINLQRDWPVVVADLRLASGDVIKLQPRGQQPQQNGSAEPQLLLSVHRAGSEAAAAATMPPPHAPGLAQPTAASMPSSTSPLPAPASPADSAAMQPLSGPRGVPAPAAAHRQPVRGNALRQAVLLKETLAAHLSAPPADRSISGSSPRWAVGGSSPGQAGASHSPSQGSSHTNLVGSPWSSPQTGSSPSSRHAARVGRTALAGPTTAGAAGTPDQVGKAAGAAAPTAAPLTGEGQRHALENQREKELAGSPAALRALRIIEGKSAVHRMLKAMQVRDLLALPPPRAVEPFKRAISTRTRETARLLCSGEQLFHTGLLVGERLRLSFWVGGRQLALPSGSAVMECRLQHATGQYQFEEAWIKALLDALEESSPLRAPYTLVLRRREEQDGVVSVDASLEAQQQNQQQWWRRLLQRLQLPQSSQQQEVPADT